MVNPPPVSNGLIFNKTVRKSPEKNLEVGYKLWESV
jgi:hypothetical protein